MNLAEEVKEGNQYHCFRVNNAQGTSTFVSMDSTSSCVESKNGNVEQALQQEYNPSPWLSSIMKLFSTFI